MKKILVIDGMMCAHCTGRVQKALEAVQGVSRVQMNLEDKTAEVEAQDDVTEKALTDAVAAAGYEVKELRQLS